MNASVQDDGSLASPKKQLEEDGSVNISQEEPEVDETSGAATNKQKVSSVQEIMMNSSVPPAGNGPLEEANTKKLQVFVRIRPTYVEDKKEDGTDIVDCIHASSKHSLAIAPPENSMAYRSGDRGQTFSFTRVLDASTTQAEYFNVTAASLVDEWLEDPMHNSVMMAYGITGAGKTFTIEGSKTNPGILPRVLKYSFDTLSNLSGDAKNLSVAVSFCEIYNEMVFDLLEEPSGSWPRQRQNLRLMEDSKGRVVVAGLTEKPISSVDDAMATLRRGARHRQRAETGMNYNSSRSHSIFTMHLLRSKTTTETECAKKEEPIDVFEEENAVATGEKEIGIPPSNKGNADRNVERLGRMAFVDLAGSERAQRTGNIGIRLKESVAINSSLMTLGRCLESLRWNQQQQAIARAGGQAAPPRVVPYRESKVTHLFRDALHGYGRVILSVNVSPSAKDYDETAHVLRYAALASHINTVHQADAPRRTIKAITPSALRRVKRKTIDKENAGRKAHTGCKSSVIVDKPNFKASRPNGRREKSVRRARSSYQTITSTQHLPRISQQVSLVSKADTTSGKDEKVVDPSNSHYDVVNRGEESKYGLVSSPRTRELNSLDGGDGNLPETEDSQDLRNATNVDGVNSPTTTPCKYKEAGEEDCSKECDADEALVYDVLGRAPQILADVRMREEFLGDNVDGSLPGVGCQSSPSLLPAPYSGYLQSYHAPSLEATYPQASSSQASDLASPRTPGSSEASEDGGVGDHGAESDHLDDQSATINTLQTQIQKLIKDMQAAEERAVLIEGEIREEVAGEMAQLLRDMEESYRARLAAEVAALESRTAARNVVSDFKNGKIGPNNVKKGRLTRRKQEEDDENLRHRKMESRVMADERGRRKAKERSLSASMSDISKAQSDSSEGNSYQRESAEQEHQKECMRSGSATSADDDVPQDDLQQRLLSAQEEITKLETRIQQQGQEIISLESQLKLATKEADEAKEQIVNLRNEVASAKAEAESERAQAAAMAAALSEAYNQIEESGKSSEDGEYSHALRREMTQLEANQAMQLEMAEHQAERLRKDNLILQQRLAAALAALETYSSPGKPFIHRIMSNCPPGHGRGAAGTPHDVALARARADAFLVGDHTEQSKCCLTLSSPSPLSLEHSTPMTDSGVRMDPTPTEAAAAEYSKTRVASMPADQEQCALAPHRDSRTTASKCHKPRSRSRFAYEAERQPHQVSSDRDFPLESTSPCLQEHSRKSHEGHADDGSRALYNSDQQEPMQREVVGLIAQESTSEMERKDTRLSRARREVSEQLLSEQGALTSHKMSSHDVDSQTQSGMNGRDEDHKDELQSVDLASRRPAKPTNGDIESPTEHTIEDVEAIENKMANEKESETHEDLNHGSLSTMDTGRRQLRRLRRAASKKDRAVIDVEATGPIGGKDGQAAPQGTVSDSSQPQTFQHTSETRLVDDDVIREMEDHRPEEDARTPSLIQSTDETKAIAVDDTMMKEKGRTQDAAPQDDDDAHHQDPESKILEAQDTMGEGGSNEALAELPLNGEEIFRHETSNATDLSDAERSRSEADVTEDTAQDISISPHCSIELRRDRQIGGTLSATDLKRTLDEASMSVVLERSLSPVPEEEEVDERDNATHRSDTTSPRKSSEKTTRRKGNTASAQRKNGKQSSRRRNVSKTTIADRPQVLAAVDQLESPDASLRETNGAKVDHIDDLYSKDAANIASKGMCTLNNENQDAMAAHKRDGGQDEVIARTRSRTRRGSRRYSKTMEDIENEDQGSSPDCIDSSNPNALVTPSEQQEHLGREGQSVNRSKRSRKRRLLTPAKPLSKQMQAALGEIASGEVAVRQNNLEKSHVGNTKKTLTAAMLVSPPVTRNRQRKKVR